MKLRLTAVALTGVMLIFFAAMGASASRVLSADEMSAVRGGCIHKCHFVENCANQAMIGVPLPHTEGDPCATCMGSTSNRTYCNGVDNDPSCSENHTSDGCGEHTIGIVRDGHCKPDNNSEPDGNPCPLTNCGTGL